MTEQPAIADDSAFVAMLLRNNYQHIRRLPDGTYAALYKLMFTMAICTGLNGTGYAYRWCFDDEARAFSELQKLENMDDEPTGFIARR